MFEKDFKLFAKDRGISSLKYDSYTKAMNSGTLINPMILEERQLNITQMNVFSRLFMERIIFLGTDIEDDVANIVTSQLLFLDMESDKPITIYINSGGGSISDGLAIYDVCKFVNSPIATTCIGMAASMAAVLLSSGDKGHRNALPHSRFMIHQAAANVGYMKAADLEIQVEEVRKYQKELFRILAENSGKTVEDIEELCSHDKWYTAKEAMDNGFIDKVIEATK